MNRVCASNGIAGLGLFLCLMSTGTAGGAEAVRQPRPEPGLGRPEGFSTETVAIVAELRELSLKIRAAEQQLTSEPETARLAEALKAATAAYDRKREEIVAASTETTPLRSEMQDTLEKMRDRSLDSKQRRELSRRNRELTMRLREIETQARSHPEMIPLNARVMELSAELRKRLDERLTANPETRALLERREDLAQKIQEMQKRRSEKPMPGPRPGVPAPPPQPQ